MPLTETAPYAPAGQIITVMEKYRETGLGGAPVSTALVQKMSMGEEIARRVVLSMRQLELIDDDGNPTPALVAFKKAPSGEYKQLFGIHLLDMYSVVFAIVGKDLSDKTQIQIEDAFRDMKPDSLRKRMVTCFVGLCEYARIVEGAPKARPGPPRGSSSTRPRTPAPRPLRRVPERPAPPPSLTHPPDGNGKATIATLESGGTVTLTVTAELADLTPRDREFAFSLIDQVKGYGEQKALLPGKPEQEEDTG